MNWITRAWKGEERLWKVFWIYSFLFGNILRMLAKPVGHSNNSLLANTFFIFQLVFCLWVSVALWRCAFNLDWRFWAYVVRAIVVIEASFFAVAIIFFALFFGGIATTGSDWLGNALGQAFHLPRIDRNFITAPEAAGQRAPSVENRSHLVCQDRPDGSMVCDEWQTAPASKNGY